MNALSWLPSLRAHLLSKPVKAAQWRILKAVVLLLTVALFFFDRSDGAFTLWASIVCLVLAFGLASKRRPVLMLCGLALSVVAVPCWVVWWIFRSVARTSGAAIRLAWWSIVNPRSLISLRALFVGYAFLVLSAILFALGAPGSLMWRGGFYITLGIGTLLVAQLIALCREPLAPAALLVDKIDPIVSAILKPNSTQKSALAAALLHATSITEWIQKAHVWLDGHYGMAVLRKFRTRFFVLFWFLLILTGSIVFTHVFMWLTVHEGVSGVVGYVNMALTTFPSLIGSFNHGSALPIAEKIAWAAAALFYIICFVLLILVYSVTVDHDLRSIQEFVADKAMRCNDMVISMTENQLTGSSPNASSLRVSLSSDLFHYQLEGQNEWNTYEDAVKKGCVGKRVKAKTIIPLRRPPFIPNISICSHVQLSEPPTLSGKHMKRVGANSYTVEKLTHGLCPFECELALPSDAAKSIIDFAVAYKEITAKVTVLSR